MGLKSEGVAKKGTLLGGCGLMAIKRADDGDSAPGMRAVKFAPIKPGDLCILSDDVEQKVQSINDILKAKNVGISGLAGGRLQLCVYGFQPTLTSRRDRLILAKPKPLMAHLMGMVASW